MSMPKCEHFCLGRRTCMIELFTASLHCLFFFLLQTEYFYNLFLSKDRGHGSVRGSAGSQGPKKVENRCARLISREIIFEVYQPTCDHNASTLHEKRYFLPFQ